MIGDVVYPADVARRPDKDKCGCGCPTNPPKPPKRPEPVWFVPPPMGFPMPCDYPHFNPYECDCKDKEDGKDENDKENEEILKANIEAQICKLAKRAAAIKKMINSFKNKNKDAIIKIDGTSYNLGSYQIITKDEDGKDVANESEYGEAILAILTNELNLIKEKLTELSAKLEEEDDIEGYINGIFKTIT